MTVSPPLVLSTRKRMGLLIDESFYALRSLVEVSIASPCGYNVAIADFHVIDIIGVRANGTVVILADSYAKPVGAKTA